MAPKAAMKAMKSATKGPKSGRRGPAPHRWYEGPKAPRGWYEGTEIRSTGSSTSSTGSSTSHTSEPSVWRKDKSKNAKNKSNKSVTDEFKIWDGKRWGKTQNKQISKPKAEPNPVAKKIPEELKKKPAAAPEKSKKDESELAPTDRLTIWITPDRDDLEEWSEWSSPSQYHMQ